MHIANYKGHVVQTASSTGGKAGKGCNKTSTIQVFKEGGQVIVKAFRFNVGNDESFKSAVRKARVFIDTL
jgi:hypothetical protein